MHKNQKYKSSEDFNYWKKCSHEYVSHQEEQSEIDAIPKIQAQM
jgi:hypothetical protein